jgi:hypothetical protein
MNDQTKDPNNSTALTPIGDGFNGYSDRVEGDEGTPASHGLFRGARVKFSNTAEWETADGDVIAGDLRLIITDVIRTVVKWGKEPKAPPEETRIVPNGQPFPDVETMNNAIPREHWRPGINGPQGPWQTQHLVMMIEPRSMDEFTFITSTVGGAIAVGELAHKVKTMRKYRGPVSPIVTLGDTPMKTRRAPPAVLPHHRVGDLGRWRRRRRADLASADQRHGGHRSQAGGGEADRHDRRCGAADAGETGGRERGDERRDPLVRRRSGLNQTFLLPGRR